MPARAEPDKLQQSSPETEPECGGVAVENKKQLWYACWAIVQPQWGKSSNRIFQIILRLFTSVSTAWYWLINQFNLSSVFRSSEDTPCVSHYHSTPAKDLQEIAESRTVTDTGPQLLSNTDGEQKKIQDCDGQTGYFAPRSEAIIQLVIEEGTEDEEYLDDNNIDGDSLDEGLGDISSDETAESPLPNNDNIESANVYDNGTQSSQARSYDSERRPSRISLETPL